MTEWCTTRSMAAAVAMGLAKMRSHSEKTRLDWVPRHAGRRGLAKRCRNAPVSAVDGPRARFRGLEAMRPRT